MILCMLYENDIQFKFFELSAENNLETIVSDSPTIGLIFRL